MAIAITVLYGGVLVSLRSLKAGVLVAFTRLHQPVSLTRYATSAKYAQSLRRR